MKIFATIFLALFVSQAHVDGREKVPNFKIGKINLYGTINEESVKDVVSKMNAGLKENLDALVIEINSPGGSINDGIDLAKKIEDYPVPVYCVVDTMAASMAFFILQSCDVRVMTSRSLLMAHGPSFSGQISGNERELKELAEVLRELSIAMAEHEAVKMCISSEEFLKNTSGKDWWMNKKEALDVGAVDYVVPNVRSVTSGLRDFGPDPVKALLGFEVPACLLAKEV